MKPTLAQTCRQLLTTPGAEYLPAFLIEQIREGLGESPDAITAHMTARSDVELFNDMIQCIDELTCYRFDRIDDPSRLLKWMQSRFGEKSLACRSFERTIRQLGYKI